MSVFRIILLFNFSQNLDTVIKGIKLKRERNVKGIDTQERGCYFNLYPSYGFHVISH